MLNKRTIISVVVLFLFIIIGFIFLKDRAHNLKNILQVNPKYLLAIFFLIALRPVLRGLRLKILTQRYGLNLVFKEWLGLTILTTFGNYLSPFRAGGTAMAVYLKKKYKFPYTFSVSLTGTLYLIQFFIFGPLGLFLTTFMDIPEGLKYGLIIFFIVVFLISIFMLFILPLPIRTDKKFIKHLANAISEFRRVRNFSFMLKSTIIDFLRILTEASSTYLAFKAFNFNAPFAACMLFSVLSGLALIISITPMALGVRESLVIIISKLIGADIMTGAFVAALDRAIGMSICFVSAPVFSYLIFKKNKLNKKVYNG